MKRRVLGALLRIAKALGAFRIARRLTRGDLRILCYHGAAVADESAFSPGLFMTGATFERRMAFLAEQRYPVLPLGDALDRLADGSLPDGATVITIDDGWVGTATVMAPILARHRFPATFYVATYYAARQAQVFNVAAAYALWKAGPRDLDLAAVAPGLAGTFALAEPARRKAALDLLVRHADSLPDAATRQQLLERLCEWAGVDVAALRDRRLFAFANADELRALAAQGVDVQLHTHRHRFPPGDRAAAMTEIEDNRRALEGIAPGPFVDFCYPSGHYDEAQWPWLDALGMRSATTTKGGFARRRHHRFELPRFLDSERITPLEFEAEMSGLFELVRRLGYRI
ncbi:MAG: hypothetical protein BroJett026_08260 [Betaproteobacteria bacterium]|nr:MAG: hypothetical protein BroJett026_08260 [Betaproteobacteria bacterium]